MAKLLSAVFIISLLFCLSNLTPCTNLNADSLYNDKNDSIYNTVKKPAVGDILIVKVATESSAIQEAGTDTVKRSDLGINLYRLEDLYDSGKLSGNTNDAKRNAQDIRLTGRGNYYGTGRTQRTSKVKAVMSVVVTEILENGNLYLVGERKVNVNDESEIITLSGSIRPQDIQADNSVYSYQIAGAKVSVKGDGVVGAQQTPGLFTKLFGWIF